MSQAQQNKFPKATANIRTFLHRKKDVVFARGNIEKLFNAYLLHAKSLGPLPEELGLEIMRKTLACATLQLALLPPDQFVAWTINLSQPRLNVFLAGDNNQFQITGRVYNENVKDTPINRLYVETQRPKHEPSRSMLDFHGLDILKTMEEYFIRSVQIPTRFFELAPDDFLMAQGMPRVDRAWMESLDKNSVSKHIEQNEMESIEERKYKFNCGCNAEKILSVLKGMFKNNPLDLFADAEKIDATCPRCGKKWVISKDEFNARDKDLGFS